MSKCCICKVLGPGISGVVYPKLWKHFLKNVRVLTEGQTDGWIDGRTQPSALSPCFAVDNCILL